MIHGQKMELALGLPVYIEGFNDNKPRACYPFTLERLTMANLYLSGFNNEDLYENFKNEEATMAMVCFIRESFRPETDADADELLHAIDSKNFAEIICDIKKVSGISDDKGEIDIQNTTESMDWQVAVNCIPVYTSTPHYRVKDLTLTQFQKTLDIIGKKINFEYKSNTVGMVEKPNEYLKDSDHPLYSEQEVQDKKYVTMKDLQGLFDL